MTLRADGVFVGFERFIGHRAHVCVLFLKMFGGLGGLLLFVGRTLVCYFLPDALALAGVDFLLGAIPPVLGWGLDYFDAGKKGASVQIPLVDFVKLLVKVLVVLLLLVVVVLRLGFFLIVNAAAARLAAT